MTTGCGPCPRFGLRGGNRSQTPAIWRRLRMPRSALSPLGTGVKARFASLNTGALILRRGRSTDQHSQMRYRRSPSGRLMNDSDWKTGLHVCANDLSKVRSRLARSPKPPCSMEMAAIHRNGSHQEPVRSWPSPNRNGPTAATP